MFDRREVHGATNVKDGENIISHCKICHNKWASYQGKRRCQQCRMLVLVCNLCQSKGNDRKLPSPGLLCEVCDKIHVASSEVDKEERPEKIQKT